MSAGGRRLLAGLVVGGSIAAAPALASPLGRLGSPFAMLVVLPVLALSLEAFGWSNAAARAIRRVHDPVRRLLAAYVVWLGTSAILTLDVSASAGASVGLSTAGTDPAARRWHLGAAMLGSNAGSLLFPFSNLTNLVVLGASGIGLGAFVATAWLPQVGAALAIGALLAVRAHRSGDFPAPAAGPEAGVRAPAAGDPSRVPTREPAAAAPIAGAIAVAGVAGAIWAGLAGLDMAVPFAAAGGLLAGSAVALGLAAPRAVGGCIPVSALGMVAAAAVLAEPVGGLAGILPHPLDDAAGIVAAVAIGAVLAASLNNLPAAAFGAAWLGHAAVPIVVAYLVGTNVAAILTPHGSAATMLVRSGGASRGTRMPLLAHLLGAWRYALVGSIVATALLVALR